jgi:hypothetical protein
MRYRTRDIDMVDLQIDEKLLEWRLGGSGAALIRL